MEKKKKVLGIIPARYGSSRFPGKPLADIHGKPMIWWVYNRVKSVQEIDDVIVATDNDRIYNECKKYGIKVEMTLDTHGSSTERVYEVAKRNKADLYLVINGDEPLIDKEAIKKIIPKKNNPSFYVANIMTKIKNPVEVVDFTNIKVIIDNDNNAICFSRSPIPYPKSSLDYEYYKHVGILIYSISALKFFCETGKGPIEEIEDINELRFLEHGKKVQMIKADVNSLSVDTPKDLLIVKKKMKEKLNEK